MIAGDSRADVRGWREHAGEWHMHQSKHGCHKYGSRNQQSTHAPEGLTQEKDTYQIPHGSSARTGTEHARSRALTCLMTHASNQGREQCTQRAARNQQSTNVAEHTARYTASHIFVGTAERARGFSPRACT